MVFDLRRQAVWLLVAVLTTVGIEALDLGDPWPFIILLTLVAAYATDTARQAIRKPPRD